MPKTCRQDARKVKQVSASRRGDSRKTFGWFWDPVWMFVGLFRGDEFAMKSAPGRPTCFKAAESRGDASLYQRRSVKQYLLRPPRAVRIATPKLLRSRGPDSLRAGALRHELSDVWPKFRHAWQGWPTPGRNRGNLDQNPPVSAGVREPQHRTRSKSVGLIACLATWRLRFGRLCGGR